MFKKIIIILSACVIAFTSVYVLPTQKADAIGFAGVVPAGITVGAGAYVVSALALSAVVGVAVGDEYGDEINAHAKKVWASSTDLAKESLDQSINLALATGSGVVKLGDNFMNWARDSAIPSLATAYSNVLYDDLPIEQDNNYLYSVNDGPFKSYHLTIETPFNYDGGWYYNINLGDVYVSSPIRFASSLQANQHRESLTYGSAMALLIESYAKSGKDIRYFTGTLPEYEQRVLGLNEAWEDMRDAGLVLPVENATAYSGDTVMTKHNPTDNTYTGIDGNIYQPNDLSWQFPLPKTRIGQKGVDGVALPDGVYVDSPALTGNPAIDNAIVNNPAIPKTTTNINTGVTTANPDFATTKPEVPVIPKDPPNNLPGTNPFKNIVPVALLIGLFDLLVAVIWYLIRMFHFIVTIGFIRETQITNPYFLWFRDLRILGIKPYSMTINLAIFFLGFSIYKSIRRVFG